MGLPKAKLSARDHQKVIEANLLLKHTIVLIELCIKADIPILLENPKSSRLWLVPEIKRIIQYPNCRLVNVDYCQFENNPWRKPTTFAT